MLTLKSKTHCLRMISTYRLSVIHCFRHAQVFRVLPVYTHTCWLPLIHLLLIVLLCPDLRKEAPLWNDGRCLSVCQSRASCWGRSRLGGIVNILKLARLLTKAAWWEWDGGIWLVSMGRQVRVTAVVMPVCNACPSVCRPIIYAVSCTIVILVDVYPWQCLNCSGWTPPSSLLIPPNSLRNTLGGR